MFMQGLPMIILNDKRFSDEKFCQVKTKKDIENSKNNSTLIFQYNKKDIELYKYCQKNSVPYTVEINSIAEFIFIHNLDAKYAFCNDLDLAKTLQKIADNYLSDTKIIMKAPLKKIEKIALLEIDGIFVI
jgi:hypothetical protein